tara:strand:- start:228 stop:443 length:216 start_codon:yes stop_codon:yes gene_type:complete
MKFGHARLRSVIALFAVLPSLVFAAPLQSSLNLLEQLSNAHGGSGFEGPVRGILSLIWKKIKQFPCCQVMN